MAEHIFSSVTSAVTGEVARALFSGLLGKLDRHAAAADKKLRRLDMLLIKIHSAVEASEKHSIENAWLIRWRDKLKEAVAEGDEVLASFRQGDVDAAAQATVDDAKQQQQEQQEHPSSSSSTAAAATTSTTWSAPSGMARNIRSATKTLLFSSDEDMERLNSAVERLEELTPEIGTFLKLLKLEILTPEQISAEKKARPRLKRARTADGTGWDPASSCKLFGVQIDAVVEAGTGALPTHGADKASANEAPVETQMDRTAAVEAEERSTLLDRLEEAFATICRSVELADGRDMSAHEWLAYWASILRDAKGQGCAVLGAISAHRNAGAGEEVVVGDDDLKEDDSELGRFVCRMESLAGEVDYFSDLARLCPSY